MRRIATVCLAVVCLAALGSLAATRESRTDLTEPPAARPSTPVEVRNFPPVQAVAGSVAVGNLPLDANGNVRVAPTPPSAPPSQLLKVADGFQLSPEGQASLGPFNVAGWKHYTLLMRGTLVTRQYSCVVASLHPSLDGTVFPVSFTEVRICSNYDAYFASGAVAGDLVSPETTISIGSADSFLVSATVEAWLYLTN